MRTRLRFVLLLLAAVLLSGPAPMAGACVTNSTPRPIAKCHTAVGDLRRATEPQVGALVAEIPGRLVGPPDACPQGIDPPATRDDSNRSSPKDAPTDTSTTRLLVAAVHRFPGLETPSRSRSADRRWFGGVTDHGYDAPPLLRVSHFGEATNTADDLISAACRTNSFIPETRVLMDDGTTKVIEDIKVGDRVVAFDPDTGERGTRTVTDTIVGDGVKQLVGVRIRTSSGESTIWATEHHPFWNPAAGEWVDAGDLRAGSALLTDDGDRVTVTGTSEVARVQRVHNLTVEGIHTYYVLAGDEPVLVHNCIRGTQGLERSFDRHSAQWFGRNVARDTHLDAWTELLERAAGTSKSFAWSSGSSATRAHLARIDGKNFVVQFFADGPRAGEVATAFVPSQRQLTAMLRAAR